MWQGQNYSIVLPHITQQQHTYAGDETTVIYSEVKEGEKVKEAAQTAEKMQRDEGELADQRDKNGKESECLHGFPKLRYHINIPFWKQPYYFKEKAYLHNNIAWVRG